MQREELADILSAMVEERYLLPEHPLYNLRQRLWEKEHFRDIYTHSVQSARSASLHWGSTLVKCFKGNEGARQNHLIFIAFSAGGVAPDELCIMKVRGIVLVSGPPGDEPRGVKKLVFGDLIECQVKNADDRCNVYSDGPSDLQPGKVHSLPSLLQPKAVKQWIPYVVEMKDVQASALSARLSSGDVYVPYVPMSSHA